MVLSLSCSNMELSPLFLLFLVAPIVLFLLQRRPAKPNLNLPPSPPSLPIIGHLHLLGRLPQRSLARLANLHGPLMLLRLGQVPVMFVSSPEVATQVLKKHDLAFSGRYPIVAGDKFSYDGHDIAFSPYGEGWRFLRKVATLEIFGQRKVESFLNIRREEADILVASIAKLSSVGPINLSDLCFSFFCNLLSREVFGKRAAEDSDGMKERFQRRVMECMDNLSGLCFEDCFPSFKWVASLTGMGAKLNSCARRMNELLEEELGAADSKPCFAGNLLRMLTDPNLGFPLTKDHVKGVLLDLFLGGTDTSAVTLEWAMAELMRHPEELRKVQSEVRDAECLVKDGNIEGLRHLRMVLKETLRLHPPAPLPSPRKTREACVVDGYDVPMGTKVFLNLWAIGMDGRYWEAPEDFRPARFEGKDVDYKGKHFQFLPFGGGRRICPGMALGVAGVELCLAKLLLSFDWELPEGVEEIDMGEVAGLTVRRSSPLLLKAIPV